MANTPSKTIMVAAVGIAIVALFILNTLAQRIDPAYQERMEKEKQAAAAQQQEQQEQPWKARIRVDCRKDSEPRRVSSHGIRRRVLDGACRKTSPVG